MTRWLSAAAIFVFVFASQVTVGQIAWVIEGVVVNSGGAVLPGVTIEAVSASGAVATAVTDGNGRFTIRVNAGPTDTFQVRLSLTGFSTHTFNIGPQQPNVTTSGGLLNVRARLVQPTSSAPPPAQRGGRPPTTDVPMTRRGGPPPGTDVRPLPAPAPDEPVIFKPQPPSQQQPQQVEHIGGSTDSNHAIVKVFYATDRMRENTPQLVSYGAARNPSGQLHLGRFDVSVPRDHRMGSLERPTIWTFWREDPSKHFVIVNRTQQTYDTFYSEVSTMVGASAKKEAFVFIHGYNVAFETAVYLTAQLAYDLGFDGPPILYSWPSEGTELAYPVDQNNNEWTVDHLRWFLEDVSRLSGAQMVHLIAHSMGNRPLAYALRQIAQGQRGTPQQGERGKPRVAPFNQIVLTAPDIDLGTFTQLAQAIVGNVGQRITLYASSNDVALQLSKKYQKYQRAGDTVPDVLVLSGIDTIDVSAVDTSFFGHSYYVENRSVLRDIFELIREGASPDRRFGLRRAGQGTRQWWVFRP